MHFYHFHWNRIKFKFLSGLIKFISYTLYLFSYEIYVKMLLKNIEFLMFITIWLPIESASLLKGSEYWKKDFINKAERAQSLCQATCVSPMICRNGECVLAQSGTRERNQDNGEFLVLKYFKINQ